MPYSVIAGFDIEACAKSHQGLIRQENQDNWASTVEEGFYVLADGMGGHPAGALAAQRAVDSMLYYFKTSILPLAQEGSKQDYSSLLLEGVAHVNRVIYDLSRCDKAIQGMGTTLCCLFLCQGKAYLAHLGDSRIYRYRSKQLELLTHDHSLVQEMIDSGELDAYQSDNFAPKNVITRSIGYCQSVEPEVQTLPVSTGDYYMLCSDGLTNELNDSTIKEYFKDEKRSVDCIADDLISAANQNGGHDNTTLIIIKTSSALEY
ncbi:MAG: Stp1/IreP family PP2C-type Ser/Thr phosphatase [Chlamydiota bacterium]